MNLFSRLDEYWDSDQCILDELKGCSTEELLVLEKMDAACIAAMDLLGDARYRQWRIDNGLRSATRLKSLAEIRSITVRHLRITRVALGKEKI